MKNQLITAYHVTDKIPLRQLTNIEVAIGGTIYHRTNELIEIHSGSARIYIFSFGSLVFYNCQKNVHEEILERFIGEYGSLLSIIHSDHMTTSDNLLLAFGDKLKVEFDLITLTSVDDQALRILALLLSHSVILDFYESHVEEMLDKSRVYSTETKMLGRLPRATKKLVSFIGECMQTKQNIITNLFIFDSPAEIWEDHELNYLYHETNKMFEITYRFKSIDYKLQLIQENLSLLVSLSSSRNGFWLEVIIVLLIFFEIVMALFNHFF